MVRLSDSAQENMPLHVEDKPASTPVLVKAN
jgi:hypothetical protein